MGELVIRKGTEADIGQIAELEILCFARPWSEDAIRADLVENRLATYIVAELDGRIVGYIGFWAVMEECQINNVAVSPLYRRQHIGTVMVDTMVSAVEAAGIKTFTLEVRKSNEAAINLYKNAGFKEEGIRKGYYEDNGEDAVIMWKED